MIHKLAVAGLVFAFSAPAFAQDKPVAAPDMQHMGPATRTPKNEKTDLKELDAYFKASEEAGKKGDLEAMAALVDFPVLMATDDAKGEYSAKEMSKEEWTATMKPFVDQSKGMKDMKMKSTGKCFVMSDDLASCEGSNSMAMGKMKSKWNTQMLMIRKDGKWKAKSMVEAGWGDMAAQHAASK